MTINQLVKKYQLTKNDCWEKKFTGSSSIWIISHDACEKIATIEGITIESIQVLNSELDFCRFLITAKMGEKSVSTIGEASKLNTANTYFGCMAEKRGIDRAILKLINAYEYGIYSDQEKDDFSRQVT